MFAYQFSRWTTAAQRLTGSAKRLCGFCDRAGRLPACCCFFSFFLVCFVVEQLRWWFSLPARLDLAFLKDKNNKGTKHCLSSSALPPNPPPTRAAPSLPPTNPSISGASCAWDTGPFMSRKGMCTADDWG